MTDALQHALYRAAKADPGRKFYALTDKVYRRDVLQRGWAAVRANNGAPGIDKTTLAEVEEYGVGRLLDELVAELREGRYRPLPARRVLIPKPGLKDEYRPLSIPAVRDRIVQAAVKIAPGLGHHQAQVVADLQLGVDQLAVLLLVAAEGLSVISGRQLRGNQVGAGQGELRPGPRDG
jgi:hypothetical protein